mmetsp:Transcript_23488/g.35466  ORF Transcript_23488/g.35466 Transcript_23488/m.35466 type:complete len:83 (-) Transcript_23488:178-426(-)
MTRRAVKKSSPGTPSRLSIGIALAWLSGTFSAGPEAPEGTIDVQPKKLPPLVSSMREDHDLPGRGFRKSTCTSSRDHPAFLN